jgi:CBS domain-containing protein
MQTIKTVGDVLRTKGNEVCSVKPGDSVFNTLKLMAERDVGAVLVLDGGRPVGIFSERDYARQVILKGKASKDTLVRDIMTTKVAFVRPQQTIEECMALMTAKRFRHLPVMDNDKLVGILSIGDVVKSVIAEQEFLIEQLVDYIRSG